MKCPKCNADIADDAFYCPECGTVFPDSENAEQKKGAHMKVDDGEAPAEQAAPEPIAAAEAAAPEPVEHVNDDFLGFYGDDGATSRGAAPTSDANPNRAPQQNKSGAALVLGIIAIVLGVTAVLSPVGVILAIIGLVLVAGKTDTAGKVVNIVGLVISALAVITMALLTALGVMAVLSVDSPITITTSTSSASSASSTASTIDSSDYPAESLTSIAQITDEKCVDSHGIITAYALANLTGHDLIKLLEAKGYTYDASFEGWIRNNSEFGFYAIDGNDNFLTPADVEKLPLAWAKGEVSYCSWGSGYTSLEEAAKGLANIEYKGTATLDDDMAFAHAYDAQGNDVTLSVFFTETETDVIL